MRLFHGNSDVNFVPGFGKGRDYHDYGNAFYCTNDFESAAEWACLRKTTDTAYVYEYELHIPEALQPKASILDFDKLDPAYWLSALLEHRVDKSEKAELYERSVAFVELYPTDCAKYDIIYGWRANDRHFAIIRDFLNATTSLETAKEAILLGNLGKQFVLKSERAFSWLSHMDKPMKKTALSGEEYKKWHASFIKKDVEGRADYDVLSGEARRLAKESKQRGTLIIDLVGF